ncbi:MAG: DivIVA domain-containing protein [Microbacteriaceae bacterium]|nr:DivIVA domain-containing protein [Microbacteriaceae bacterium]
MSTTFPRTRRSRLGYNVEQVEDFLEDARRAYSAGAGELTVITAATIRSMAFVMQKGGYLTTAVDAAMERLEDAFSAREREASVRVQGDAAWYAQARSKAQEILDRLARPETKRFSREGILSVGYHPVDVDDFTDRLVSYFQDGGALSATDVRGIAFRPKRGGYSEAQVDLVLDGVLEVMLAVR